MDWGLFVVIITPFIAIKVLAFIYLIYRYFAYRKKTNRKT